MQTAHRGDLLAVEEAAKSEKRPRNTELATPRLVRRAFQRVDAYALETANDFAVA